MSQKMIVRSFWSIFLVVYLIAGYVWQAVFVKTEWAMDATLWDKFVTSYLRSFTMIIVPSFVIALILGFLLNYSMTNRPQSGSTPKRDNRSSNQQKNQQNNKQKNKR